MSSSLICFKTYDVRGQVPEEINDDIAYRIGRAYAKFLAPKTVVVGYDIRLSSKGLVVWVIWAQISHLGQDLTIIGIKYLLLTFLCHPRSWKTNWSVHSEVNLHSKLQDSNVFDEEWKAIIRSLT